MKSLVKFKYVQYVSIEGMDGCSNHFLHSKIENNVIKRRRKLNYLLN